jgi:hypothetical protein
MNYKHEFFIAGKTRNKDAILKICDIFDKNNVSYYCFLKDDDSMKSYGDQNNSVEENMEVFENLDLKSDVVLKIFNVDLENEKACKNFLLVLPAGNSGHIEAGIAYGMGKKCYAIGDFDATDSLYNIFETIFKDNEELDNFLNNYK